MRPKSPSYAFTGRKSLARTVPSVMGSSYIFPVRLSVTVRVSRWPSFLAGRACLCVCMLICSFYANERPVVLVNLRLGHQAACAAGFRVIYSPAACLSSVANARHRAASLRNSIGPIFGQCTEHSSEVVLCVQDSRPKIPNFRDPVIGGEDGEVARIDFLDLLPANRHRHARLWTRSWRIYRGERLPPHVLVVVEEYLPGPFVDGPLHRYVAVVRLNEVLPDRFAGGAHHIVVELPKDGHIHMKPRSARGLDEGRQGKRV